MTGSSTTTVKRLFENFFQIPGYQRLYDWGKPQVEQLLNDLKEHFGESEEKYLLNAVLVWDDGVRLDVIDGQQRITTLFLLFAAARDYGTGGTSPVLEQGWTRTLQAMLEQADGNASKVRITDQYSSDVTQTFITALAGGQDPVAPVERDSLAYPLYRSYRQILDWLQEQFPNGEADSPERFQSFVRRLREDVTVALIAVESEGAAWRAFERANDRGKPLSVSDLFKSDLFNAAETDQERTAVAAGWKRVLDTLRGSKGADPDVFLHHVALARFSNAKVGRTAVRSILCKVLERDDWTSEKLCGELELDAKAYVAILSGDYPDSKSGVCVPLYDMVHIGRLKNFRQGRPVLLAGSRLENPAFARLAEAVEQFALVVTICNERGQTYEKTLFDAAKKLRESRTVAADEQLEWVDLFIAEKLKPTITSLGDRFQESLNAATVAELGDSLTRYLLYRVDHFLESKHDKRRVRAAVPSREPVDLEHILPESCPASAVAEFGSTRVVALDAIDALGNRTLWESKENSGHRNQPYAKKRKAYEHSRFLLTRALAGGLPETGGQRRNVSPWMSEATIWSEAALLQRQGELTRIICELVGISTELVLPNTADFEGAAMTVPSEAPGHFMTGDQMLLVLEGLDAGLRTGEELIAVLPTVTTSGVVRQIRQSLVFFGLVEQSAGPRGVWELTDLGREIVSSSDSARSLAEHVLEDTQFNRVTKISVEDLERGGKTVKAARTLYRSVQALSEWAYNIAV